MLVLVCSGGGARAVGLHLYREDAVLPMLPSESDFFRKPFVSAISRSSPDRYSHVVVFHFPAGRSD